MFPFSFMILLGKFLKALPYIVLVGVIIFGVAKLGSCSGGLSDSKAVLNAHLETQKEINVILKESNDANNKTVNDLSKSSQVSLDTVVKQSADEKKLTEVASKRELDLKNKLAEVLKNYQNDPKSLETMRKKDLQISTIQINSVWESYCSESADTQCKAPS